MSDRRRTLRSTFNHVNQATTASTSTSTATSATVPPYKVDSDSDDGDCFKSYLDELARPSVSTSTKKQTTSLSKNRGCSNKELAEDRETKNDGESKEQSVKPQTSSSERATSNVGLKDGRGEKTREPAVSDQGSSDVLFAADVVLEPDSSDIQSNTVDSSSQSKLDGVLPESTKSEDGVCLMDTDQENEAEVIRPPKRRTVLRPVLDDDSTDDENDLSQSTFSTRFPGQETSVGCEIGDGGEDRGSTNDQDPLASQSVTQENESQTMVGKSILETMATSDDELLPSQDLLESDETSNKTIVETLEEGIYEVTGTSSAASSSMDQGEERIAVEEKLVVDVDSSESQHWRRMRSDAAEKAAAAAESRQRMTSRRDLREACSSR